MLTLHGKRKDFGTRRGRGLRAYLARSTGLFGTRTGRVVTLVMLIVGGGFCFAAWLQAELQGELNARLHPHSTVAGHVLRMPDAAITASSSAESAVQASEAPAAPAQRPPAPVVQSAHVERPASGVMLHRAAIDKLPPVRQPIKSAPETTQISSPPVLPPQPVSAPTTQNEPREPSFMSTFAHH